MNVFNSRQIAANLLIEWASLLTYYKDVRDNQQVFTKTFSRTEEI